MSPVRIYEPCDEPDRPEDKTGSNRRAQNPQSCAARNDPAKAAQRAIRDEQAINAVDDDVQRAASAARKRSKPIVVPKGQRNAYRANTTLRAHYIQWMRDEREQRLASGTLSQGSHEKMRDALTWWERMTRPADWPEDKDWPGWPLNAITPETIQDVIDRSIADGSSSAYVRGLWYSLRVIINDCRRRKVHRRTGQIRLPKARSMTAIYNDALIEKAYRSLAFQPMLQVAFVVGCNTGMRPVDLFTLEWASLTLDGDRPCVEFDAEKTGKLQRLPLAPVTVAHLLRLPRLSRYVFPGFSAPETKRPEKSVQARMRTHMTKLCFRQAGIPCTRQTDPFYQPWQRTRPTCNERLERHAAGTGQFVLGHSLTLNSASYREPSQLIIDAIMTLPQPACFMEILKRGEVS